MSEAVRVPPRLGVCFGWSITAPRPLHYLREGRALDTFHVDWGGGRPPDAGVPPLLTWSPPAEPFAARLHEVGDRFHLWIEKAGWFVVAPDDGVVQTPPRAPVVRTQERVWGMPALLCLLRRGMLPLHAAAVEVDGGAVIFGAPGRGGKTTLAGACALAGLRVLAEDVSAITSDHAAVLPGPAMLRLRHDVVPLLGRLPGREVGRDDDRVHVALERPGDGAPVPLRTVVLLREGPTVESRAADPAQALRDLWALSFNLPTTEDRVRCFGALADLVAAVPVVDLFRPMTAQALDDTIAELARTASA